MLKGDFFAEILSGSSKRFKSLETEKYRKRKQEVNETVEVEDKAGTRPGEE